jgi:transcriptional regulator with XRE-family HTH domain
MVHLRIGRGTIWASNRSTSRMDQEQARELGRRLRERREEIDLSIRELAARTRVNHSTIVRLEQGAIEAPAPDKLSRIADALGLSLADVYALADYSVPTDLPSFRPYLRTKYRGLPAPALEELERSFRRIAKRHGLKVDGPAHGEDELPEQPQTAKKGGDHGNRPSNPRRQRKRA